MTHDIWQSYVIQRKTAAYIHMTVPIKLETLRLVENSARVSVTYDQRMPVYMLLKDKAYRLVFYSLQILTSAGKMFHMYFPFHILAFYVSWHTNSSYDVWQSMSDKLSKFFILDHAIFKLGEFRLLPYPLICYDRQLELIIWPCSYDTWHMAKQWHTKQNSCVQWEHISN